MQTTPVSVIQFYFGTLITLYNCVCWLRKMLKEKTLYKYKNVSITHSTSETFHMYTYSIFWLDLLHQDSLSSVRYSICNIKLYSFTFPFKGFLIIPESSDACSNVVCDKLNVHWHITGLKGNPLVCWNIIVLSFCAAVFDTYSQ